MGGSSPDQWTLSTSAKHGRSPNLPWRFRLRVERLRRGGAVERIGKRERNRQAVGEGAGELGATGEVGCDQIAAVGAQDAAGDGKPQPAATGAAIARGVATVERIEDVRQVGGWDAGATVRHTESAARDRAFPADGDTASGRRVAH